MYCDIHPLLERLERTDQLIDEARKSFSELLNYVIEKFSILPLNNAGLLAEHQNDLIMLKQQFQKVTKKFFNNYQEKILIQALKQELDKLLKDYKVSELISDQVAINDYEATIGVIKTSFSVYILGFLNRIELNILALKNVFLPLAIKYHLNLNDWKMFTPIEYSKSQSPMEMLLNYSKNIPKLN